MIRSSRAAVLALLIASFSAWGAVSEPTANTGESEGLLLNWPDEEGWAPADRQENQSIAMVELVRKPETLDRWTQIGTMIWYKGMRSPDMRANYAKYVEIFKRGCPDVRTAVHVVEQDAEFPRLIFSQECPRTPKDGHPEAALWLIVQGKQSLYAAHRALKAETLPEELRNQWVEWLKTARVVRR
jgi:hypothetical protein